MKLIASFPYSRTKVTLPRRRKHLLARPRLLNLLNQFLDKKLILISAPAGYGKTSLLVDFANQCELPVCWLALDELDRDPQRFITYFIAALAEHFPSFGAESMAALNNLVTPDENIESLIVTLTNEIFDTIREHFILALDDYHLVEDVELIQGFLSRFLKLSDESCHLVLSSRRLARLPNLPRMIADEQVEGLDFAELAFRPEEIQLLFVQNYSKELTEESARELAEQSEGWITGLQLAGLSSGITDRVRVARATGMDLNQYFEDQVLYPQSPEVHAILLYTSLFDEFDADLCQSVLADLFPKPLNWSNLLGLVLENNLFVLPVGSDGRWLRYHHLFRDFLRGRLQEEQPEQIRAIQLRLVNAYESRGEWERAYHTCHQIDDPELLAGLIERAGPTMFRRSVVTLTDWLNALPPALANSRPGLLSLRGGIGYLHGNYHEALSLLNQAEAIYRNNADVPGLVLTLVRRSTAHINLGDYNASLRDAEDVLQLAQNSPDLQLDYAEALRTKGLALLRIGGARQALENLERSLALYMQSNETDSVPILLTNCGMAYRALGNYDAAKESYLKALEIWRKNGNLTWQTVVLNNLGILYQYLGEYENANLFFQEGLILARRSRYIQTEAIISIGIGDLYAELEEFNGATQAYEQAEIIAQETQDQLLLSYLALAKSALLLAQGHVEQAERILFAIRPAIDASNSQYETGLWSLQNGRLALFKRDVRAAIDSLVEAERCFIADGRELETSWSRVWLAAALSTMGSEVEAREKFQSLVGGGNHILHALVTAIRQARPWLGTLRSNTTIGRLVRPLFQRADQLDARLPSLRRDLRRLPQSVPLSAPRLGIHSLGWTKVAINGRTAEWPTQSVRELFFFFLNHQKPLTKEQVAEELWPDLDDPERIKQRFKNELYRLRRVVGHEIILLDGELYRFNRSLDYDHDLDDFETYLARAPSAETDADRIENYEKAVNLIIGPYLADIGAAWAILDRERLQRDFLEAAIRLAELHWKRNDAQKMLEACQRALEFDPACEPAHQLAMRAHATRGDRAAIARQYQTCKEISQRLFKMPPAEETENLYRQLMN